MGLGLEDRWLVPTSKWKKWKRNLFFFPSSYCKRNWGKWSTHKYDGVSSLVHQSCYSKAVFGCWNRGSSFQEFQVKWKLLAAADQSLKVFHALNAFFLLTLFPPSAFTDLCPASSSKCTQSLLKSRGERVKSFHCNEEGPAYPRVYF